MQEFQGKVAVITGGASGIGLGIARRCVREGMNVVLADIEDSALAVAEAELTSLGGTVLPVCTDVSQRVDVEELAKRTLDAFGQVHLLFNNAGVAAGVAPWEATWNDWEWVLGVNLWGVIHGIKVFTPIMLAQNNECHIVNTASTAGLVVGSGCATYAVTKHAVVALSECLYLSLQQRQALVKASVLCPGMVNTNIDNVERTRPETLRNEPTPTNPEMEAGRAIFKALIAAGMAPDQVAESVFRAIRNEQFYILSHPEWTQVIQLRTENLLRMVNPVNPTPAVIRILGPRK